MVTNNNSDLNSLLIFPQAVRAERHGLGGGAKEFQSPAPDRQIQRLSPRLKELQQAFDSRRAELRDSPTGTEIEKVLVIELVGDIKNFFKTLKRLEGLEWLAEYEEELSPDDDFYISDKEKEEGLSGRLYLIMSNQKGLEQLFRLWRIFCENPNDPKFEHGLGRWKTLFCHVKDIRPWGPQDRVRETGLKEDWLERVEAQEERVRVEVELWCRQDDALRTKAQKEVERLVGESKGKIIGISLIEEIAYHGILAELPIEEVEKIIKNPNSQLIKCEQIMHVKPTGQAVAPTPEDENFQEPHQIDEAYKTSGNPVVAIFDGMPVENHGLLKDRLVVDDPDGLAKRCQVNERFHGTAMASIIIHGDLDAQEEPLKTPIYIRPIFVPNQKDIINSPKGESVPEEMLPVDLIYRSVRRLYEGDGEEGPIAPNVKVINLSLGDFGRPFIERFPSPLARLLDFLSYKYDVLFLVSAGNIPTELQLGDISGLVEEGEDTKQKVHELVIRKIQDENRKRRILSPAEGINVLTIGAMHEDGTKYQTPTGIYDLIPKGMPSPIMANGLGFKRSVKPEILFPGGRQIYREGTTKTIFSPINTMGPPGLKVASPSKKTGDVGATRYLRGTSCSTAMASREAVKIVEMLEKLNNDTEGGHLSDANKALLVKALLVHGASWNGIDKVYTKILGASAADKDVIAKYIGYGPVERGKVLGCPGHRATMLGFGSLKDEEGDRYEVPLPMSLSGQQVMRRVSVTLAWFTPIMSRHRMYRQASLWFSGYGEQKEENFGEILRVSRKCCQWQTVKRGTVQHEIWEGDSAVTFSEEDILTLQVNCKSENGRLEKGIDYAVVVSCEVPAGVQLPIYQEIRDKIQTKVAVSARAQS